MNKVELKLTWANYRNSFVLLGALSLVILMTAAPSYGWAPLVEAPSSGMGMANNTGKILDLARKMDEMDQKADALGAGNSANYNPPGMPQIPISCGGNQACSGCYEKAIDRIGDLRESFEKLRLLHKATDDYVKASTAFGDGMAGVTGFAALQWHEERKKIQKSWKGFEGKYRKKYTELVGSLEEAMRNLGACEKEHFGEDDWYSRFGSMFVSFMALHYQK